MKKQHKTYLLLIAVLVIWGMIGYQIYTRLNPPIPELEDIEIETSFKRKKVAEPVFYEISEPYRDPFLGGIPQKKIVTAPKKVIQKISNVMFPPIKYHGELKGANGKSYIISVYNNQEIFKIGTTIQQITLLKATENEVVLKFEKETKTFQKL